MINKVLLMEFFKDDDIKVVDKDFYIKSQMKSDVIKYITILEEENERLKEKCDYLQRSCDRKEEQRDLFDNIGFDKQIIIEIFSNINSSS